MRFSARHGRDGRGCFSPFSGDVSIRRETAHRVCADVAPRLTRGALRPRELAREHARGRRARAKQLSNSVDVMGGVGCCVIPTDVGVASREQRRARESRRTNRVGGAAERCGLGSAWPRWAVRMRGATHSLSRRVLWAGFGGALRDAEPWCRGPLRGLRVPLVSPSSFEQVRELEGNGERPTAGRVHPNLLAASIGESRRSRPRAAGNASSGAGSGASHGTRSSRSRERVAETFERLRASPWLAAPGTSVSLFRHGCGKGGTAAGQPASRAAHGKRPPGVGAGLSRTRIAGSALPAAAQRTAGAERAWWSRRAAGPSRLTPSSSSCRRRA